MSSNRNHKLSLGLGVLSSYTKTANGVEGKTPTGNFQVTFYSPSVVRFSVGPQDTWRAFSYAVVQQPQPVEFDLTDSDKQLVLSTTQFRLVISKSPVRFRCETPEGEIINEDDPGLGTQWIGEQLTTYKKLQPGERFVGLGEKNGPLDKRGRGYVNWNTDAYGYGPDTDPLYCTIPFYIGIHGHHVYGLFLDNSHKTHFNFGASTDRFASFSADAGEMNYYFIQGKSTREILNHYTWLTGRMPLPPLWSVGYQQCRYSYYPDKEVIAIAENFHQRDFPGDAIVLDIHYMEAYKIFTWDKKHFPDPKGMIDRLKSMGFEVVVMCDPGIKIEEGYPAYESGKKEDIFVKYPDGGLYSGQVWPGWCHFPDFTNPKARAWWARQFSEYVNLGVEGFWNDMNEIATWGNTLPELMEFDFEGEKTTTREGRNVFGMMMSRSTYEGTKALLGNKRPFNLTRSGYAGIQRYAAVWTGDNVAYDAHMMAGVRLLNSMGLSGLAFTGYDIGGFVGNADEKLFARWMAIGTFSPFYRGHSMINSRDSEPWSYGERVEEISRNYMKLRYRLLPYIYSLFYEASQNGMPLNRSLAFDYPFDQKIYDGKYQNQYFFGPALLVIPAESNKDLVKTYLPEGNWFDFYTDKPFGGSQEMVAEAPIDVLPVFVRGSSILPMRPNAGRNSADTGDTLELHVYAGNTASAFEFYEDDGRTYDYEQGTFALRKIEYDPTARTLTLQPQVGTYATPYRSLRVCFHGFDTLTALMLNSRAVPIGHGRYQFLNPISNFDPINTQPDAPHISSLPSTVVPYDQQAMVFHW